MEMEQQAALQAIVGACTIWLVVLKMVLRRKRQQYIPREPQQDRYERRQKYLNLLLREKNKDTHNLLRVNQPTFELLVKVLKSKGLRSTKNMEVDEQVAMFLNILGHDDRLRSVAFHFSRSLSTVHRHFLNVLNVVMKLYMDVVKQPGPNTPAISGITPRPWHHFFRDAIGAIDGTYIPAKVKLEDQPRYRTRKHRICQNVMGVVGFDMKFIYVLAGWEGSASDANVLSSAVRDVPTKLVIPSGTYYLVDAGYGHYPGFLAPYRQIRYHRSERRRGYNPATAQELYNYRHSSMRNIVERAFGMLKKRWAILRTKPFFDIDVQGRIVLACCALHNFILIIDPTDLLEEEPDIIIDDDSPPGGGGTLEDITLLEKNTAWDNKRDYIAADMWLEYGHGH